MALLLYGIRLSGDSLQRARGGRLRRCSPACRGNRLIAVASGAAVTAIIQSSAATTLMLIGFVAPAHDLPADARHHSWAPTSGRRSPCSSSRSRSPDYAPLLVGFGFTITFRAPAARAQGRGQAMLGLGLDVPLR
jgi:phosphate:Na+ symporter